MIPINKGWSEDKKYRVTLADGTPYLLRVSSAEQYSRKKAEFKMMQRVSALGVPICQPIKFGTCCDGVYSLQSWIDGRDAEDVIPLLPHAQQYIYGLESGQILKKLHSIPAPETQENWEAYFNRKADHKIKSYHACPVKFSGADRMIEYINDNRHLLKNRVQSYQHGDYHIGNMMIDHSESLMIIDFNRNDFGDPWEEFNRIVWCVQSSPPFASGMINGYFDHDVPMEFWRLLALYIASNMLSSIPWAIPFGQSQIDLFLRQAKDVLAWYDNMRNPVPTWYQSLPSTGLIP